ncbi:DUF2867 domain-containing protein [Marinomonas posidonica]|uniref:DUF2867 domain-containing protein n=1 Tax=Marinomonas posidonica TaxID=936476 RepID=UPI0037362AD9
MLKVPSTAAINQLMANAYFTDCFTYHTMNKGQSAMQVWLDMVNKTPRWVEQLMWLRNRVVILFGLKNLGLIGDVIPAKQACDYLIGDQVGIFKVLSSKEQEVILEDKDKHLDVKLSLFLEPEGDLLKLYVTTVVHVKNRFGKVYMFFVAPVHKKIVPATLARLESVS